MAKAGKKEPERYVSLGADSDSESSRSRMDDGDSFSSEGEFAKKSRSKRKRMEGLDTEDEYIPGKKAKPKRKKAKSRAKEVKLPSRASITILAQITESENAGVAHVEKSVLERIKKALALADHPGTSEQEARAAMRMATKLMSQHSVTQAAVLATMDDAKDRLKKAGMSTVTVRCKEGRNMNLSAWSRTLGIAMQVFFDCKYYTESFGSHGRNKNRIDFVFYGLAEQTIAAVYAFEMTYNLILTWRAENKEAKGMHAKNCYCHGVADGLHTLAEDEKDTEQIEAEKSERLRLEMAKKEEAGERQKEIDRLHLPDESRRARVEDAEDDDIKCPLDSVEDKNPGNNNGIDSDSDSDYGELMYPVDEPGVEEGTDLNNGDAVAADFTNDGTVPELDLDALAAKADARSKAGKDAKTRPKRRKPKKRPAKLPEIKPEKVEPKSEVQASPWETAGQLVAFRKTAGTLADDFLKAAHPNMKLRKMRRAKSLDIDDECARKSYNKGWDDAKKIDVRKGKRTDDGFNCKPSAGAVEY